jgi:hypothetical protein
MQLLHEKLAVCTLGSYGLCSFSSRANKNVDGRSNDMASMIDEKVMTGISKTPSTNEKRVQAIEYFQSTIRKHSTSFPHVFNRIYS